MLRKIPIRPGVVLDDTEYAAAGYAVSSQWVRAWNSRMAPLGGWRTKIAGFAGVARKVHRWAAIDGTLLAAVGTHSKLYVVRGSRKIDITPERSAGTLANDPLETTAGSPLVEVTLTAHGAMPGDTVYLRGASAVGGLSIGGASGSLGSDPFTTQNGSNRVQVAHTAHGLSDGDRVYFDSVTAVAGIPDTDFETAAGLAVQVLNPNSYYVWVDTEATSTTTGGGTPAFEYAKPYVITVLSANAFTVNAGAPASSSATGGGAGANYSFDISAGRIHAGLSGAGFGSGAFGAGAFGVSAGVSDSPVRPRLWALDHAGEDLIANISGGAIYQWSPWNLSARATVLPNSPAQCLWMFVTPAREVMALGCTTTDGDFDPLCWRHTHPQEITTWTPAVTNSAGEDRVQAGSRLVGGRLTSQGILVWTDTSVYTAVEVGAFDQTYRFDLLGASFGLAGPNAVAESDGVVFWLDPNLLAIEYSGGTPQALWFPMREWLDEHVNKVQIEKIYAHPDSKYPAVTFLVPADGDECNTYIRFDYREAASDPMAGWWKGEIDRTAWYGEKLGPYPLAMSPGGVLYEHEYGFSADGAPIPWHVELAPLTAGEGDFTLQVSRIVLDARREENIQFMLRARNWPSSNETFVKGPFTITPTDRHTGVVMKHGQIGIRFFGEMTKRWRFGDIRWDINEATKEAS